MTEEKQYIISESELLELLSDNIRLAALDRDGVDNWSWYGESFRTVINEYLPNDDNATFQDCAKILLKDYVECK